MTEPKAGSAPTSCTVFAALWAAASIFHVASYARWLSNPVESVVVVAAFWCLLRPSSTPRLALLAAVQVCELWTELPRTSNHWLYTAVANLTLLTSLGWTALRARGRAFDRMEWFRSFAPLLRVQLCLLYFFVVFHKLNTSFLDVDVSCGTVHYLSLARKYGLPRGIWARWLAIYSTLIIETLIPLLLLFRRTRSVGVLMAALFHFMLAVNPLEVFYNFTSMLYASFFLFVPEALPAAAYERWRGSNVRRRLVAFGGRIGYPSWSRAAPALILVVALVYVFALPKTAQLFTARTAWVVYGGACLALFWSVAWRPFMSQDALPGSLRAGGVAWIWPVALLFNGFCPYLGLKSETSFAMFSNLRTEGERTNHLMLGTWMRVFDYQSELVTILESDATPLADNARKDHLMTWFSFRQFLVENPETRVTYLYEGEVRTLDPASSEPSMVEPLPYLEQKLLGFRRVDGRDTVRCSH